MVKNTKIIKKLHCGSYPYWWYCLLNTGNILQTAREKPIIDELVTQSISQAFIEFPDERDIKVLKELEVFYKEYKTSNKKKIKNKPISRWKNLGI
jgi:hypothetical protein